MIKRNHPTILVSLLTLAGIFAAESVAFPQVIGSVAPAPTDRIAQDDDEAQIWQGRVAEIRGNNLVMKIEGELETFDVSPEADIRKNRRKCPLARLAPRDFATIVTVGEAGRERVTKIRAFSVR